MTSLRSSLHSKISRQFEIARPRAGVLKCGDGARAVAAFEGVNKLESGRAFQDQRKQDSLSVLIRVICG